MTSSFELCVFVMSFSLLFCESFIRSPTEHHHLLGDGEEDKYDDDDKLTLAIWCYDDTTMEMTQQLKAAQTIATLMREI